SLSESVGDTACACNYESRDNQAPAPLLPRSKRDSRQPRRLLRRTISLLTTRSVLRSLTTAMNVAHKSKKITTKDPPLRSKQKKCKTPAVSKPGRFRCLPCPF